MVPGHVASLVRIVGYVEQLARNLALAIVYGQFPVPAPQTKVRTTMEIPEESAVLRCTGPISNERPDIRAVVQGILLRPRADELSRETLAVAISLDAAPEDGAHVLEATIDGEPIVLGLSRVPSES